VIAHVWPHEHATVDNTPEPHPDQPGGPGVKKTLARLAAARPRLTTAAAAVAEARAGLYTTGGLACGTASAWVTWGVGAGLAGAGVSLLLMGVLSDTEKGAAR